jgi:hypothetical protein
LKLNVDGNEKIIQFTENNILVMSKDKILTEEDGNADASQ